MRVKDSIAAIYGDLVHEGKQLDLACADIEAFLRHRSSASRARSSSHCGPATCLSKASSPAFAARGNQGRLRRVGRRVDGSDALGYARILSLPGSLQTRAGGRRIMKSVVVDKVASVAQHSELGHELRLSADIPCEEGVLVAVRVLNNKTRYNQLELTSGRMATVNQGDVVVGALGHRKALRGYSGHLPTQLEVGDSIQMLNIGGVLGICDSANPDVGAPFDCEVLGTVLHFPYLGERIGVPARAGSSRSMTAATRYTGRPVVALAGTCMDSGKTAAACAIVGRLRHLGCMSQPARPRAYRCGAIS